MKQRSLRLTLFAALFAAMMAVGAHIQFPIPPYPVPMTMQTACLYMCGLLLPKRYALYAQLTYVVLGLLGLPVFTGGGGIAYVLDPRFGYILAFVVCAPLLQAVAEKTLYAGHTGLYIVGGFLVLLLLQTIGVVYMGLLSAFYLHTPLPMSRLLYLLLIFLPLDAIKLAGSTVLALQLRRRLPGYFLSPS